MSEITLVTAFYDIGRSDWKSAWFNRKSEEYLKSFETFLNYDYQMIIFVDDKHYDALTKMIAASEYASSKKLIRINETWMQENIWAWSRLDRETEIMNSVEYKSLIPNRIAMGYPENVNPKYTIITHSKIDFVGYAIDNELCSTDLVMWIDFGYFHNKLEPKHIPHKKIATEKFNWDTINLCGMNPIDESDRDVIATLKTAHVKICAYLFAATKVNMKKFQTMCHDALLFYQENGIADDEQAVWLHCYFTEKSFFSIHLFSEWHLGLKYFSRN